MAKSSGKEPKPTKKTPSKDMDEKAEKASSEFKPSVEEDEDDLESDEPISKKATAKPSASKTAKGEDEDDEDDIDVDDDDWNKPDEEDSWDPDFEEFDLPKSKSAKPGGKKKGGAEEEEEFKVDEEFKDMGLFDDAGFDDEDEDF